MTAMERRRNRLSMLVVAVPAVLFVLFVAGLAGPRHRNAEVRWSAVNHSCPALAAMVASLLQLKPEPLPADGTDRTQFAEADRSDCWYAGPEDRSDGSRPALTVTVIVHPGEMTHSGHQIALRAVTGYPPSGFRPVGPQSDGVRFGFGGTGALDLQLVEDNAAIRLMYTGKDAGSVLRAPLLAVANQAIANIG